MSRNFSRKSVDIWVGVVGVRALVFGEFPLNPLENGVGWLAIMYMNIKGFFYQFREATVTDQFFQIKRNTWNLSFQ